MYISCLLLTSRVLRPPVPYIYEAIRRIKRTKLHHEKLQHKRLIFGKIVNSRCCLLRDFKNTCYCARSSKRHKNSKVSRDSSIRGTVSSACGLVLAVSYRWLYRLGSRKKKRSLSVPRISEYRAIFFYSLPCKTCTCKRSNFVGTGAHFYPSRSASFDV